MDIPNTYDLSIDEIDQFLHSLQANAATSEECKTGKFTRNKQA
jgi:hypothetical protein